MWNSLRLWRQRISAPVFLPSVWPERHTCPYTACSPAAGPWPPTPPPRYTLGHPEEHTHTHTEWPDNTHTHTQPCLTAVTRTQPNNNTFLWDEIWPSSPKGATENMTTAEQEIQNVNYLWFNEIQNDLQQINQVVLIEAKLHRSLQYLIVIWQSQQIFL